MGAEVCDLPREEEALAGPAARRRGVHELALRDPEHRACAGAVRAAPDGGAEGGHQGEDEGEDRRLGHQARLPDRFEPDRRPVEYGFTDPEQLSTPTEGADLSLKSYLESAAL